MYTEYFELDFLKKALETPKILKENKVWLDQATKYLVAVSPSNHRLSSLYENLMDDGTVTIEGHRTSLAAIRIIWQIIGRYNRSDYLPSKPSQVENTRFSSAVPWGLFAFKKHFGTKYSQWEHDNPRMSEYMMGPSLKNYFNIKVTDELLENRLKFRDIVLDGGNISDTEYTKLKKVFPNSHQYGYDNFSKFYWCMLTQTWIFSPKKRNDDMITSLVDIDMLDEELDKPEIDDLVW